MPGRKLSLVLIQDGLGDLPVVQLGGRTPLEAARTPCMDQLVKKGSSGLLSMAAQHRLPGTDIGHLALFGQEADNSAHRRGPMEAAGAGFELLEGDVAVRFNFARLDPSGIILDRRAGRVRDTRGLISRLGEIELPEAEVFFLAATEHRGVIVLRGEDLNSDVSDSDPRRTGVPPLQVEPQRARAGRTAILLNQLLEWSKEALSAHDLAANAILIRDAGSISGYRSIPDLYGLNVACVSGESTVLGLARLSGFDAIYHESMTANLDTDLARKVRETVRCLEEYDLVYLHLKGCDIAAHDLSPEAKRDFIERTDDCVASILKKAAVNQPCVVSVSDHATYSHNGEHHWNPIPFFMSGPGLPVDSTKRYGEEACRQGGLGNLSSEVFVESLFRFLQGKQWNSAGSRPALP